MILSYYPYQIPFKKPFKAGARVYKNREGLIIEMIKDGITAYGEAAPLPGFSKYSNDDVIAQCLQFRSTILNLLQKENPKEHADAFYNKRGIYPSLCFAIDTLICDFHAQQKSLSAADYLFETHEKTLPVNGVISALTTESIISKAEMLLEQGYETLKMKVTNDFSITHSALQQLRDAHPAISMRIDANRRWKLTEAIKNLNMLEQLNIEYCEEPLVEPSPKLFQKLSKSVSTPLAIDETVSTTNRLESYLPFTSFIIVKPMVIGSLAKLFATKALANHHDNTIVFTTSLESGIGRLITATLASGLGAIQTAHGLATGSLLTMDVYNNGTYINNGRFTLPHHTGLGKRNKPNLENIAVKKFTL